MRYIVCLLITLLSSSVAFSGLLCSNSEISKLEITNNHIRGCSVDLINSDGHSFVTKKNSDGTFKCSETEVSGIMVTTATIITSPNYPLEADEMPLEMKIKLTGGSANLKVDLKWAPVGMGSMDWTFDKFNCQNTPELESVSTPVLKIDPLNVLKTIYHSESILESDPNSVSMASAVAATIRSLAEKRGYTIGVEIPGESFKNISFAKFIDKNFQIPGSLIILEETPFSFKASMRLYLRFPEVDEAASVYIFINGNIGGNKEIIIQSFSTEYRGIS